MWAPDQGQQGAAVRSGAVDDPTIDEGVDISITDEIDSDLDLIAGTSKGKGPDYIGQDN
jgi:hypothetical protein